MNLIKTLSELSFLREHLEFFCFLILALPPLTFLGIKLRMAKAASKVQYSALWYVPPDLESDAMRVLRNGQHAPAFSTRQIHPDPQRAMKMAGARPKRRL